MKRLLTITALLALVSARPETYKETEDFQYARSSTDEGSKSGFYGAQRGNMGGNYERAHNMDGLAQHQMSTAVKQVEGELGDASKMNSGSVFTSANSGGMFGSGKYDVSNLQGRNFQENYAGGESLSHSSLSSHQSAYNDRLSSSTHNTGYNSLSQNTGYRGYQGSKNYGQGLHLNNLQTTDNIHNNGYGYGAHAASHSSGYSSQSGYQAHSAYDSSNSNANQYSSHSDYATNPVKSQMIYTTPVKIVGRPGSRVAIPLGVQTYDATHSASTIDQNAINSEAEVLNNGDQYVTYRPTSNAKHYESSYNYRKQWEKHDVKPEILLVVSTDSPLPQNSELYDDTHTSNSQYHTTGLHSQNGYSSSLQSGYNSNVKTSAAQLHQSTVDSHHATSNSNAYRNSASNLGISADTAANVGESTGSKPKGYHSSYSYRKSWERQGDPYEIPIDGANGVATQRLTAAASNQGYSAHKGGSAYHQSHQGYSQGSGLENCDCDEFGHARVARSVRGDVQQTDDLGQHTGWDRPEDLGQQVQQNKWENLEELGQQQQKSGWERLEDLRPQVQNHRHNHNSLAQEDLGQQVQQNKWNHLEDLRQQTQEIRFNKPENNQQAQSKWRY